MRQILITGANRGLGLEFTRQLLAGGDFVFAACRAPERAQELQSLQRQHPKQLSLLTLDVAQARSVESLPAQLTPQTDRLDVLINNAGVLPSNERFGKLDGTVVASTLHTNAIAPLLLAQALADWLKRGAPAVLMNISSILGSIAARDSFYTPSYCISKAALNMVTRLLAHELKPAGVTVFCAHPGWVRTDMGGAQAPLAPAEAIEGLLRVLNGITPEHAGRFFGWDGQEIPW